MTDLAFIQEHIPSYADYGDVDARHSVDKQIRAYLGEALSEARDRLTPSGAVGERLDGILLRCEFTDQRVIRATDHARFDAKLVDRVHELDRALVEIAERTRGITTDDELSTALDDAARVLDERFGAISDADSPSR
jgi:hypothetical protein